MTHHVVGLACVACGHQQSDMSVDTICGACGGFMEMRYDLKAVAKAVSRDALARRRGGMWRYREVLPVRDDRFIVSLKEGGTPLLKSRTIGPALGLDALLFKDLTRNPTGSFKDYSASTSISKASELGVRDISLASAGNASAAFAAYCSVAGITFHAFLLPISYKSVVAQNLVYGADAFIVPGSSADAGRVVGRMQRERGSMDGGVPRNPYRVEGKKIIGYEIAEDLGWSSPDRIVCPTAGGTSILGLWKAFNEMQELGWVDRLPKLDCIQAESCQPIVAARRSNSPITPAPRPDSIATGLLAPAPAAGPRILDIIARTGGEGAAVSDDEIRDAQRALARDEGLFVEPSAAASLAGLRKLVAAGHVRRDESVVLMLTGAGIKSTETLAAAVAPPLPADL